jgi:DinB superfamily
MSTSTSVRPASTEYAPDYARYVDLVTEADVIAALENQFKAARGLFASVPEEKARYRYAHDKWSIKEVLGHVVDAERVFSYRALRFARYDSTELPGFDQDTFAANANFDNLPLHDILREYEAVRMSTVLLFKHLASDAWTQQGIANGNPITVRAVAFAIAGHELHHLGILRSKYLPGL